jgi:hypothetical protein
MGFDSPQNAKLFIQLDSIALNSSSHPGNRTLTTPTMERITSIYNQMKSNNSTGGFTQIASVAMQTLDKRSFFDGAGRNIIVYLPTIIPSYHLAVGTGLRLNRPMQDLPNTPFFIEGHIAVGQNADGRLQVFTRGSNNHILTGWQTSVPNIVTSIKSINYHKS